MIAYDNIHKALPTYQIVCKHFRINSTHTFVTKALFAILVFLFANQETGGTEMSDDFTRILKRLR